MENNTLYEKIDKECTKYCEEECIGLMNEAEYAFKAGAKFDIELERYRAKPLVSMLTKCLEEWDSPYLPNGCDIDTVLKAYEESGK